MVRRDARGARRPSLGACLLVFAISVVASLALAEVAVSMWFRAAFPHLNIYASSDRYGVVLKPSAAARVRSRSGRVTEIRTNSLGFRGAEWAPPSATGPARVMLLGDSQMLGYHVEETQGTAAELERQAGWVVLDAAVPSWGPIEYALAVEELAPVHRPDVVVFVANLANDWVESNVANTKRNEAADGWIRRKSSVAAHALSAQSDSANRSSLVAPARTAGGSTSLAGAASLLFTRSQLVFAVRELIALSSAREAGGDLLAGSTAAEQLLRDLPQLSRPKGQYRSRVTPHLARVQAYCAAHGCRVVAATLPLDVQVDAREWAKYRGEPRRAPQVGAPGRARESGDRQDTARESGDRKDARESGDRQDARESGDRQDARESGDRQDARESGDRKDALESGDRQDTSREPLDVSRTLELAEAFRADAADLGVPAIDLLPVLREVSPGAFLSDDVHLSPRGHQAVARALIELIRFPKDKNS